MRSLPALCSGVQKDDAWVYEEGEQVISLERKLISSRWAYAGDVSVWHAKMRRNQEGQGSSLDAGLLLILKCVMRLLLFFSPLFVAQVLWDIDGFSLCPLPTALVLGLLSSQQCPFLGQHGILPR